MTVAFVVNSYLSLNWLIKMVVLAISLLIVILLSIEIACLKTFKRFVSKKDSLALELHKLSTHDYVAMKKYLKRNSLMNDKMLKTMINHYLVLNQKTNNNESLLTAILTIVSITTSFLNNDHLDITKLSITITILISTLFFYYMIKTARNVIKFYNGDDNLYKNLEEIITAVYSETIKNKNHNH